MEGFLFISFSIGLELKMSYSVASFYLLLHH